MNKEIVTRINDVEKVAANEIVVEVTDDVYDYALNVLPPKAWSGSFFAMGEAYSHNSRGEAVYYCFLKKQNRYFVTIATIPNAKDIFSKVNYDGILLDSEFLSTEFNRVVKTKTFETVEATNDWLEKHPDYGVIGEKDNLIHVALLTDKGIKP